jgi:hypothetical protein
VSGDFVPHELFVLLYIFLDSDLPYICNGPLQQVQITKLRAGGNIDEIYGLLHLVTAPGHLQLSPSADVISGEPIPLTLYDNSADWSTVVAFVNQRFPVVVFSKVGH